MKLKSILILALVAVFVACGVDAKVKKLNKAAAKGNPKKVVRIMERIIDKYDKQKDIEEDWTPAQIESVSKSLDLVKKNSTIEDYKECEKKLDEIKQAWNKVVSDCCN